MKIYLALIVLMALCQCVFATSPRATISDDAILMKLDAIDTSLRELKETVQSNKTSSDTKIDTKFNVYDTEVVCLRERATALEIQLKIVWAILGIGTVGGGSIYGGIKFQQRKNGSPKQ